MHKDIGNEEKNDEKHTKRKKCSAALTAAEQKK